MTWLSDCNWTRTHNHLVHKRILNHLAKLAKWLSCIVSTYLNKEFLDIQAIVECGFILNAYVTDLTWLFRSHIISVLLRKPVNSRMKHSVWSIQAFSKRKNYTKFGMINTKKRFFFCKYLRFGWWLRRLPTKNFESLQQEAFTIFKREKFFSSYP